MVSAKLIMGNLANCSAVNGIYRVADIKLLYLFEVYLVVCRICVCITVIDVVTERYYKVKGLACVSCFKVLECIVQPVIICPVVSFTDMAVGHNTES